MQPLEKVLRNKLERNVKEARDIAEDASLGSIEQLGVGQAAPFDYLSEEERELRRKLRVHGRQLGDRLDPKNETQEIERLVEEVSYEHWHRMLFARFLVENNLLMYPDPDEPVAVTLEECEDLAAEEGAMDGWELASRFAARMLPQIFRIDSPVFRLTLPPEHQQKLKRLLDELPAEVFTASDSLGWVYQFWQSKKKDAINASEVKIGARELPAVTQLFTEAYMVNFLLDNSLGAWWSLHKLSKSDLQTAENEEELRRKASLPGVPLQYLRFVKSENDVWTPAAGDFGGWPEHLSELKTLDPCCGSGHFLVTAFLMLVPIRMELEGLTAQEAVDAVLRDNLHGLDIDQRVVEIAAFALALTAWRYPDAGGYRRLPELNVACSGLSVSVAKDEWKQPALEKKNLRIAMDWMYDVFKDAPILGSLLNPAKTDAATLVEWEELSQALEEALSSEQSEEEHEAGVVAYGLARAANLLAGKYHWVITNVPYLARGKQDEKLRDFCEGNYKEAKNDLATAFLDRCMEFCHDGGTSSIVLPQNWLFLTTYRKFREKLLISDTWHLIARLGPGAFETISGEVVKAILLTISRGIAQSPEFSLQPSGPDAPTDREGRLIAGLDVSAPRTAHEKAQQLIASEIKQVGQAKQLENPDARVSLKDLGKISLLEKYAYSYKGITTGDDYRYRRQFWESKNTPDSSKPFQSTVESTRYFGGYECSVLYDQMTNPIQEGVYIRAKEAWDKLGVMVSQMRELLVALYCGTPFDTNAAAIVPHNPDHLPAIWCFCSSLEYNEAVRQIDQSLKVTNATLVKVPFDLDHWQKVAAEKYPNGLPEPYSDDPTQWIFHGHPAQSDTPLLVAVARLLGYRWPAELDPDMELSAEARKWVVRCEELLPYSDSDGIVCIPPVRGEQPADDRLLNLLAAAYGDVWSTDKLSELLKQADHAGKTLETWLRDRFFMQHCKLFHHRPFIWHIWDGLHDGFAALVNYHKLDSKLLETLIYTYLGDWINRRKRDRDSGVDAAEEKLAAAEILKKKLELILKGEAPHDIFVRWKPIEKQPVGWDPDINDGVRLNIRPFMTAGDVRKKGAGVLREKPNIKWTKDRGKDVESAPWYHRFNGDRINDHHLTLEEKRVARTTEVKETK